MNPFLYKAHPVLAGLMGFLLEPSLATFDPFYQSCLIVLSVNVLSTVVLRGVTARVAEVQLSWLRSYLFALPGTLFYLPAWLTLLGDVLDHAFRWQDRYLLVFALAVAAQMLGALYGYALRVRRRGRPIGLGAGLTISMALLLAMIFAALFLDLVNPVRE